MTYEEIRDLIGQVLALDEEATTGPWTHYRRANTEPREWPAWALADVEGDEEEQRITAEGEPNDIALITTYRTAAPTLARELQRLLAEHADGAWVSAADLRRALEGKEAVGNDPLVLQVQRLRMEYANLLADADASQHWRTRALRAEAALEEARSALRLATDPKPDDLLGVRLVNGCASLPDDTPAWVADLIREAWQAIRVLRADAEGKAARLDVMETERNEARDRLADARADHLDAMDSAKRARAERDAAQVLVANAIANAGRHAARPLWSHIMHLFAVGSTRAHALCAEHGYDPDQEVGPSKRPQRKA